MRAPWFHLKLNYPKDFKEFLWKTLKDSDRQYIRHNEQQGRFPEFLSPLLEERTIEPMNSLGLRHKGEIVGWMVTHRIDIDTIRYSSLFIERSLQKRSLAMKLLIDSLHLHALHPTKSALVEMPYNNVDSDWIHLVNKHLVPYATEVIISMQSWITLSKIH